MRRADILLLPIIFPSLFRTLTTERHMSIGASKSQLGLWHDSVIFRANLRCVCRFQASIKVSIPYGCKDSYASIVRKIQIFALDISKGKGKELNSIKGIIHFNFHWQLQKYYSRSHNFLANKLIFEEISLPLTMTSLTLHLLVSEF